MAKNNQTQVRNQQKQQNRNNNKNKKKYKESVKQSCFFEKKINKINRFLSNLSKKRRGNFQKKLELEMKGGHNKRC